MAKSGSVKALSVEHEEWIAKKYGGVRSPSSGAADRDRADVRTDSYLFECKHRGTYDKPARSITFKLDDLEKVADEAWSEGKRFAMPGRVYCPASILSDSDGNVDVILYLVSDDLERPRGRFVFGDDNG